MKDLAQRWLSIYKHAGALAADAVLSLAEDRVVIPMLEYSISGEDFIERILSENMQELEASITKATEALQSNPMKADSAFLLYPAQVQLGESEYSSIFIDMRNYRPSETSSQLIVPYTITEQGLAIHQSRQLDWTAEIDIRRMMESFFDGVFSDEEGARIWNECLDRTL